MATTSKPPADAPVPTSGRTVLYALSTEDVKTIKARRNALATLHPDLHPQCNEVEEGQLFPMVIVRAWGDQPDSAVNGRVQLDGTDEYWATSRTVGDKPGTWRWPTRG